MQSYIGITAFTKVKEVDAARKAFNCPSRKLMIGVVATYKSLRLQPMKEYWAKQTPHCNDIKYLFTDDPRTLNLVHYSSDQGKEALMATDMRVIAQNAGRNFHGFQINMAWPDVRELHQYHEATEVPHYIVLQIGKDAISMEPNPAAIGQRLRDYREVIDAVIVDMSGGTGKALDAKWTHMTLAAIKEYNSHLDLVVAGGLGPDSLQPIEALLKDFPDLSWDAQKLLRDKDNNLDPVAVELYLKRSAAMLPS